MEILKYSKFNESTSNNFEDAISGYDNAIVLFCDHAGSKMIKDMKDVLNDLKLEAFAKDNRVIIMSKEPGEKTGLNKFKKTYL